jgi:hypothetical protein
MMMNATMILWNTVCVLTIHNMLPRREVHFDAGITVKNIQKKLQPTNISQLKIIRFAFLTQDINWFRY